MKTKLGYLFIFTIVTLISCKVEFNKDSYNFISEKQKKEIKPYGSTNKAFI
jgi:hypothetical protein